MALLAQGPIPVPGKLASRARRAAWLLNEGVPFCSVQAMFTWTDVEDDAEENEPDAEGQIPYASTYVRSLEQTSS